MDIKPSSFDVRQDILWVTCYLSAVMHVPGYTHLVGNQTYLMCGIYTQLEQLIKSYGLRSLQR